jgi:hypothetical protein
MYEAGVGYGIAAFIVLIIVLNLIVLKCFFVGVIAFASFLFWKQETRPYRALALALIPIIAFLVLGEAFPQMIDAPALHLPQLCELHWTFPFHLLNLLNSDPFENCYTGAATFQKSAVICPQRYIACINASIAGGARDCSGFEGTSASPYCYYDLALETGNASLCGKSGDFDLFCYQNIGEKMQDAAACEVTPYRPSDCITSVLYGTKGNATCENLSNPAFKSFCLAQKNATREGVCQGIHRYPCIARYYADPGACAILGEMGDLTGEEQCRKDVEAISDSNGSICEETYQSDTKSAAECIYWVLRRSQNKSVCDGLSNPLLKTYCMDGRQVMIDGNCLDPSWYSIPIRCIAKYSNDSSLCDLVPEDSLCP